MARAYVEAGSQVILTNTFRANAIAMEGDLDAINRAGVAISKRAAAGRALVFRVHRSHGANDVDSEQAEQATTPLLRRPHHWPRPARTPCWWRL